MSKSLASIRKSKGYSQERLGRRIAERLGYAIGDTYAQRKIARFEAGTAAPTEDELLMMAEELDLAPEMLRGMLSNRAPIEGASMIDQASANLEGGRSLLASCVLSRARPETLTESFEALRAAIKRRMSVAVFVPYPSVINTPKPSEHINNLFSYYFSIRRSISESNLAFKTRLGPESAGSVALFFPRAQLIQDSALLIPPIFRQYSLTIQKAANDDGPLTKSLHMWTPGTDSDKARPVRATGVYSVEEQIDAWESYFGDIVPHWVATGELQEGDAYWEQRNK